MPLNRRDIIKVLPKKGFTKEVRHHIYFHHRIGGKETGLFTKVSHSGKEISDSLITPIRKQLKLDTNRQVRDLKECPMSGDDYIKILEDKGIITNDEAPPKGRSSQSKPKRARGMPKGRTRSPDRR